MGKYKIALCDKDEFYCRRFAEYMIKYKPQEMELAVYSDAGQFVGTNGEEEYDLVLAGSGFESVFGEKQKANVLLLTDGYAAQVAEPPMWEEGTRPARRTVCKYQPMEQVLHEMYALLGREADGTSKKMAAGGLEIIGVCSPCGHEMQMMFSALYAVQMGKEKKVLYLNFQEFSGFLEVFGMAGERDMGDVVIRLRNESLSPEYFWQCVYEMSGISVLLPFENPENIRQTGRKELEGLLEFVEKYTDFEMAVIDFGVGMDDLAACMGLCGTVFKLCRDGFYDRCRDNVLTEWLTKSGEEALLGKMQTIYVPYHAKNIRGGNVIEQLQWSGFGDFVRKIIRGMSGEERGQKGEGYGWGTPES